MIKIFGIERSCTNYVKELLTLNFGILPFVHTFGDKHGRVNPEGFVKEFPSNETFYKNCTVRTIICVKNPYHWFYSIRNYCENTPSYEPFDAVEQMQRYNKMYLHWYYELQDHPFFTPVYVFRHEDLLRDLDGTLSKIDMPRGELRDTDKVRISNRFTPDRREMYLKRKEMEPWERGVVNMYVSDEFFKLYGYEREF